MQPWVTRALAMTVLHAAAQTVVAAQRATDPGGATWSTSVVLGVLVGVALLWGAVDGWRRVERPARTWCVAALVAGPAAGVVALFAQGLLVDATGPEALGNAVVGGAFTALLVLVPALVGAGVGSRMEAPRSRAARR